jgi:nucleotide-binding universal stress UspA family protein
VVDARPNRLADHILTHAEAEGVDLIVIGGHHPHNVRESLFGDIGKMLAHRAHCPLLLMPSA